MSNRRSRRTEHEEQRRNSRLAEAIRARRKEKMREGILSCIVFLIAKVKERLNSPRLPNSSYLSSHAG